MDEVEERVILYSLQQRVRDRLPDLIPTDLGHKQIVCEPPDAPAQQT